MVSINPSTFVEGGVVPVDKNLTWKEARFNLFDYTTKAGDVVATTTAARIKYVDEDGTEYVQQYSAADPNRFTPSEDGKKLVPVGDAQAISKSSNFYMLMSSLVNAGFPANKLDEADGDISILDGLMTHNIGMPEPKRSGLARPATENARDRVISVPDQILKLPWENKGKAKAAAAGKDDGASADALSYVTELVSKAGDDGVTRQQVAAAAIKAKKPAIAKLIFNKDFAAILTEGGLSLDGDKITLAS